MAYLKTDRLLFLLTVWFLAVAFTSPKDGFTAAEQQQVSIATPGLFEHSNAFNVDFSNFRSGEYSFPCQWVR